MSGAVPAHGIRVLQDGCTVRSTRVGPVSSTTSISLISTGWCARAASWSALLTSGRRSGRTSLSRSRVGSPGATCRKRFARSDRCTMLCSSVTTIEEGHSVRAAAGGARPGPSDRAGHPEDEWSRGARSGDGRAGRRDPRRDGPALVNMCDLVREVKRSLRAVRRSDPPRNRKAPGRNAKWNVSTSRSCIDRIEIDQQVAARDQVEMRERRISITLCCANRTDSRTSRRTRYPSVSRVKNRFRRSSARSATSASV